MKKIIILQLLMIVCIQIVANFTAAQIISLGPEETVYEPRTKPVPQWPYSDLFPAGPNWPSDAFISTVRFNDMDNDELRWFWPTHNYLQIFTGTLLDPREEAVPVNYKYNYYEFWRNSFTDDASRPTPFVIEDISGFSALINIPTPPTFVPLMTEKRVIGKLYNQPDHPVSKYGLVWIGSIYKIDERTLLGFTHNEAFDTTNQYTNPDGCCTPPDRYYSVGLAISKDRGLTWDFLGEIIKSNTYNQLDGIHQNNINGGVYTVVGDYFYCYFLETAENNMLGRQISVARERVSDVVAEALKGNVTEWHKYTGNDTWASGNALGGLGASINLKKSRKALTVDHWKPAVVTSLPDTPYVLLSFENFKRENETRIYLNFSKDGLNFNSPGERKRIKIRAGKQEFAKFAFLVAIRDANDDGSVIFGKDFFVYYTVSPLTADGNNWDDFNYSLLRKKISIKSLTGDYKDNGCVDLHDLKIMLTAIRNNSENVTFDLNSDGAVNIADARKLVTLFTNPRGAPCQ